jgi:predicted anti-sigma-YlaC factor YlaD
MADMAGKCSEYLKDLNEYLDGTLDPAISREIMEHVGHCENCRIMIDTMKQTVVLCRDGMHEKLPDTLESKLKNVLRIRWEEHFKEKNF